MVADSFGIVYVYILYVYIYVVCVCVCVSMIYCKDWAHVTMESVES